MSVFEKSLFNKTVGPKKDEVTGEWRRLHNEELYDLYSLPNIIRVIKSRRMGRAGHVACMEERRGAYRVLVGRPERKRPPERPKHKWENNLFFSLLFRPTNVKSIH
jgi:hypothetical protein